jgi:hypothetical protein
MIQNNVRLSEKEIQSIVDAFKAVFPPSDQLWIFGSRVDRTAKGGDIDLYIESQETDAGKIQAMELKFLDRMIMSIGDQKIDIVIKFGGFHLPIYDIARKEGVRLV